MPKKLIFKKKAENEQQKHKEEIIKCYLGFR